MTSLAFKIKKEAPRSKNIVVSFSAEKFERLAASFGLFRKEFLDSLARAEMDIKAGRTRKITSLASLRK